MIVVIVAAVGGVVIVVDGGVIFAVFGAAAAADGMFHERSCEGAPLPQAFTVEAVSGLSLVGTFKRK